MNQKFNKLRLLIFIFCLTLSSSLKPDAKMREAGLVVSGIFTTIASLYVLCSNSHGAKDKILKTINGISGIGAGLLLILLSQELVQEVDTYLAQ
jgi:hypothetical protein